MNTLTAKDQFRVHWMTCDIFFFAGIQEKGHWQSCCCKGKVRTCTYDLWKHHRLLPIKLTLLSYLFIGAFRFKTIRKRRDISKCGMPIRQRLHLSIIRYTRCPKLKPNNSLKASACWAISTVEAKCLCQFTFCLCVSNMQFHLPIFKSKTYFRNAFFFSFLIISSTGCGKRKMRLTSSKNNTKLK